MTEMAGWVSPKYATNDNLREQDYKYNYNENNQATQKIMRDNLNNDTKSIELDARSELYLSKRSLLSLGIRYYALKINRFLEYENFTNSMWRKNHELSDNFNVKGEGYAGYVKFSSSIGDLIYDGGIRLQQDNIGHQSYKADQAVCKQYFNFFPFVNIGYSKGQFKANVSYSRGIGYIPYNEITPAITYQTEYSYTKGNPNLDLTIDNTFQIAISLKKWNLYYDYYYSKGDIYYLTFTDPINPLVTYSMPENTGTNHFHVVGVNRKFRIRKWWTIYGHIYMRNRKIEYPADNEVNKIYSTALFCNISNDLIINNRYGGFVNLHAETSEKVDDKILKPTYSVSIGAYRYFFDKKLVLKITSQPLVSKLRNWEISKRNYWSYNKFMTSQTNFKISLTYNFQTGKKGETKQTQKVQYLNERTEIK